MTATAPSNASGPGSAWDRVRGPLRGLTTRGRSFIAAGLAATACAFLLGQSDLLRVGVLLIAIPLGCAVMVARSHLRVRLERIITPRRAVSGSVARVRLELTNLAPAGTAVLLAEDHVPYRLGPSPRFVVARLPGGRRAAVSYSLRTTSRGRYEIGPLSLTTADPFGMCELTRSFTATDALVVLPQTWPLVGAPGGGHWAGSGEASRGMVAASGEHDLATREYRHGDDLRRVHWRSTARRGELMVRRDEQPRQMRATVLLDTRYPAHRGEGPVSSFEWAVSAAASIASHLTAQRYAVRLVTDEASTSWTGTGDGAANALLDRLALVELDAASTLASAGKALRMSAADGIVTAVLGDLDQAATAELSVALPARTVGIAVLLNVPQWAQLPPAITRGMDEHRRQAADTLRHAGWLVAEAGPLQNIGEVWTTCLRVAAGGSAPSPAPLGVAR